MASDVKEKAAVIPGSSKPKHVESNISVANAPILSQKVMKTLQKL